VPAISYTLCVCVRARLVRRNGKCPRLSVSNKWDIIFNGSSLLVKKFYSQSHPSHAYYTSLKYFRLNQQVAGRYKTPGGSRTSHFTVCDTYGDKSFCNSPVFDCKWNMFQMQLVDICLLGLCAQLSTAPWSSRENGSKYSSTIPRHGTRWSARPGRLIPEIEKPHIPIG
jgi:hypothetical protein